MKSFTDNILQWHFSKCSSTQFVLKEQLLSAGIPSQSENLWRLVSCQNQWRGHGRQQKKWESFGYEVAFSFVGTMLQNPGPHGALVLAVCFAEFLENYFQLPTRSILLKWPNDLFTKNLQKFSGILGQSFSNQSRFVFGIGANLFLKGISSDGLQENYGTLIDGRPPLFLSRHWALYQRLIPRKFLLFLETDMYSIERDFETKWNSRCFHLDKLVYFQSSNKWNSGYFRGIGSDGSALIEHKGTMQSIRSGGLRFESDHPSASD